MSGQPVSSPHMRGLYFLKGKQMALKAEAVTGRKSKRIFPPLLSQHTTGSYAKMLHVLLQCFSEYEEMKQSPFRCHWGLSMLAELEPDLWLDLPCGTQIAIRLLAEELPFKPSFTRELSLSYLCNLIIQLAYHVNFVETINS